MPSWAFYGENYVLQQETKIKITQSGHALYQLQAQAVQ